MYDSLVCRVDGLYLLYLILVSDSYVGNPLDCDVFMGCSMALCNMTVVWVTAALIPLLGYSANWN
jgi:hypothetical protein